MAKNNQKSKNNHKLIRHSNFLKNYFFWIVILFFVLTLPAINNILIGDSTQWIRFYCTGQFWFTDIGHPSLSGWLTNISCIIFGVNFWAIRLPFIIISLGVLCSLYFLGKKIFPKNIVLLSCFILTINPWFIGITNSTNQDNYILLFATIAILSYAIWLKNQNRKYLYIAALAFGLGLISKSAGILILGVIVLHQIILILTKRIKIKRSVNVMIILTGLIIPIMYYAIQFITGSTLFSNYTVQRTTMKFITSGGYFFPIGSWVMTVVLATPVFFILLLISISFIFKKNQKELDKSLLDVMSLLWLWVLVPVVTYSFLIINNNIERFLQLILPATTLLISITISYYLRKIKFRKNHSKNNYNKSNYNALNYKTLNYKDIIFSIAIVTLIILVYIFSRPQEYPAPYYSLDSYIQILFSFKDLFFPIISDMGPVFYLPGYFIIFVGLVSILLLLILIIGIIISRRELVRIGILLLFISYIIASLIIISEFNFSIKGPNISGMMKSIDSKLVSMNLNDTSVIIIGNHPTMYSLQGKSMNSQFSREPAILHDLYLIINSTENDEGYNIEGSNVTVKKGAYILYRKDRDFDRLIQRATDTDIVILEDFPPLPRNNPLINALEKCKKIDYIEDKGLRFYFYKC
ncbi:MAG: glycosyltransferase family 39 protein [Candidatus Woesearchaeota archaeon]